MMAEHTQCMHLLLLASFRQYIVRIIEDAAQCICLPCVIETIAGSYFANPHWWYILAMITILTDYTLGLSPRVPSILRCSYHILLIVTSFSDNGNGVRPIHDNLNLQHRTWAQIGASPMDQVLMIYRP